MSRLIHLSGAYDTTNEVLMNDSTEQPRGIDSRSRWNPKVHPVISIIVVAGALAGAIYSVSKIKQATDRAWREEAAVANERPFVEAGSKLALATGIIATDQRALRDVVDAVENHNKPAFESLYITGKIFTVPKQTHVLILENTDNGESKVRILDGKYNGIEGWVSDNWFR